MNVLFFLKPKQEVCVLHKGYTLRQGIEKMRQYGFAAVPVIDEEGRYCGIVTRQDIMRYFARAYAKEKQKAEE